MGHRHHLGENHFRRSHDFRRKKNKKFFIVIAIVVLVAFVVAFDFGGIRTMKFAQNSNKTNNTNKDGGFWENLMGGLKSSGGTSSKIDYVSIKDLSQNPSNYLGKEINIKGELSRKDWNTEYGLEDGAGYWVFIGDSGVGCIEKQRDYNFGSTYYATGTWIKRYVNFGKTDRYSLSCNSPISNSPPKPIKIDKELKEYIDKCSEFCIATGIEKYEHIINEQNEFLLCICNEVAGVMEYPSNMKNFYI